MKSAYFKKVLFTIAGSAIPSLLLFSAPYFANADYLSLFSSPFVIYLIPFYLLGFGAAMGCLSILAGKTPANSLLILIACLTVIGCAHLWNIPIRRLTRTHFRECIERGRPLVTAIKAYQAKHSKPPVKLEDLVPKFLPKIPETGLQGNLSHAFEYRTKKDFRDWYEGEPWVLEVNVTVFMEDTRLSYFPDQHYPDKSIGWIERYGDWALISRHIS